jgi:hypothetical protein
MHLLTLDSSCSVYGLSRSLSPSMHLSRSRRFTRTIHRIKRTAKSSRPEVLATRAHTSRMVRVGRMHALGERVVPSRWVPSRSMQTDARSFSGRDFQPSRERRPIAHAATMTPSARREPDG